MKILSIPIKDEFPYSEIPHYKYDLLELRLDYAAQSPLIPDYLLNNKLINASTIITIRDPSEGGINPVSFNQKITIYNDLIKSTNCLIEIIPQISSRYSA